MENLKELVIDVLIVLFAWFCVSAATLADSAKGLGCGRIEASQVVP